MSLIGVYDPVALFVLGIVSAWLYKHWLHDRNRDWFLFLSFLVPGVFWLHLVSAWYTGVAALPVINVSSMFIAGVYAAAYVFWFRFGGKIFFLLKGRNRWEGGLHWLLTLEDQTESHDASREE